MRFQDPLNTLMKVIVAGSRYFSDREVIEKAIDLSGFKITQIVHGGARGVDTVAGDIANDRKLELVVCDADWVAFGRSAGFRRNETMAVHADALVAVWDGKSPGTRHMIQQMRKRNKPVYIFRFDEQNDSIF